MLTLDYKNPIPLHEQISSGLKELICCGSLSPDEKLPSVRELAVSLTVNPNTVQHAYKELEAAGFIYSLPGKGNFVAGGNEYDDEKAEVLFNTFIKTARELCWLGESEAALYNAIKNIYKERNDRND